MLDSKWWHNVIIKMLVKWWHNVSDNINHDVTE